MAFEVLRRYQGGSVWRELRALGAYPGGVYWEPALPPRRVYHYTNVEGLEGIVRSNALWASSAYYLNDSSEVEYGCNLLLEVIADWEEANAQNHSPAAKVLRMLGGVFRNPFSHLERAMTTYVACFCEDGNLLSQWRAYGRSGGYSIEFGTRGHELGLRPDGDFWQLHFARVEYERQRQRDELHSLLGDALPALGAVDGAGLSDGERGQLLIDTAMYVQSLLLGRIVAFKNPAFREEKEWRLIARPAVGPESQSRSEVASRKLGYSLRRSGGSLLPYIELLPVDGKMPIASVRYGPSLHPSRVEGSVRMLLMTNGHGGVAVSGSEIPVIL